MKAAGSMTYSHLGRISSTSYRRIGTRSSHENGPVRKMHRIGYDQPHVPIDAGAGEPSGGWLAAVVDANGDDGLG